MAKQKLAALFHCVYSLHYHLVIVTKYRRKLLTSEMLSRFRELAGKLIEANGEADHIHMLFTMPPKFALADFVNALKTGTSRRLRSEFAIQLGAVYRKPVLWSRSYCVISCGGAPLAILKQYIESQERPE
ncbi:MAG TPA: IS200/IS605 family transposase [Xanthobacteraceae bacterium]